ncbi:hypothetical protein L4D09_04355 [Photobacterium makurazakiensis]|uniref:hypothetical protein n=1 Tax=Photobacterium makurazakiensis TaxID=2910234 RepID=UPI003D0AE6D9
MKIDYFEVTFATLRNYEPLHLVKGDVLVLERGRNPHNGCHALIEQSGDRMLVSCIGITNSGMRLRLMGKKESHGRNVATGRGETQREKPTRLDKEKVVINSCGR